MSYKKAILFGTLLTFTMPVAHAKDQPSLKEERFKIDINFKNNKKKHTMTCTLSSPCEINDHMRVQGYPQPVRIVLDLSSKRHNKSGPAFYNPTGYRYNFTIDTGDEGDFLNTAHLSKRGELPPFKGTSFTAPLTYWYKKNGKKNGSEVKKVIDHVHVNISVK